MKFLIQFKWNPTWLSNIIHVEFLAEDCLGSEAVKSMKMAVPMVPLFLQAMCLVSLTVLFLNVFAQFMFSLIEKDRAATDAFSSALR